MKLGRLLLAILLPLCIGLAHAADIDHLIKQQTAISAQVKKVKASEKEESLFLEEFYVVRTACCESRLEQKSVLNLTQRS